MIVETFPLGELRANCYLIYEEEEGICAVIDPGGAPDKVVERMREKSLQLQYIFLTHGHFDHIMGVKELQSQLHMMGQCPVCALDPEKELLLSPAKNLSYMVGDSYTLDDVTYISDGEKMEVCRSTMCVIATPGHTLGGCCYYFPADGFVFTGDTLFCAGVGRSDFPTGDEAKLLYSIRERLSVLPDETVVYPGHMGRTTIGAEKRRFC